MKLSGQVVEADTGYAIPNAEIRAWTVKGEGRWPQQTTKTDDDGRFKFDTLADATYTLYVGGSTFADTRHKTEFKAGQAAPLKLEVTLDPGSSLRPKVPPTPSQTNQNTGFRTTTNAQLFIQSDDSSMDPATGLVTLNGNVVIQSGDQILKADSAVYDTRAQKILSQNGQAALEPKTNFPSIPIVRVGTNSIPTASQETESKWP